MRARSGENALQRTDRTTLLDVLRVDGFDVLNLAEHRDYVQRIFATQPIDPMPGRASATLQLHIDDIKRAIVVFHGSGLELASYTIDLERVSKEQTGSFTKMLKDQPVSGHRSTPV